MVNINHFRIINYMGRKVYLAPNDFINNAISIVCKEHEADFCTRIGIKFTFHKLVPNLTIKDILDLPSFNSLEEKARKAFKEYLENMYPLTLLINISSLTEATKIKSIRIVDMIFTDSNEYYNHVTFPKNKIISQSSIAKLKEKYRLINDYFLLNMKE